MILAQIKYHDTVRAGVPVAECGPGPSLQELFTRDVLPFAVRSEFPSVLKETFCADEMLYSLRPHHDDLFKVFEKYIARTVKEAASSLKVRPIHTLTRPLSSPYLIHLRAALEVRVTCGG